MRIKFFSIIWLFLWFAALCAPSLALAAGDQSLTLTVTPPLAKINMEPGEMMATALEVVNNNDRPVTVYAKVVDFKDRGDGSLEFLETGGADEENIFLSQWITLSQDQLDFNPFESKKFAFTIKVPENAQPGGHYAAILVGTNPPPETEKGAVIRISSYLSSLLLVKIAGAVDERGLIREFSAAQKVYQGGENSFTVRFQNVGNVHLRPVGTIKIYDMFGKEKGSIGVNENGMYGNVLPKSEREWDNLKWTGEDFFIFNRYRAELSLSYGDEAKQTDVQTLFFWGANFKWLGIIGGSLVVFLLLVVMLIKFYIRQSVKRLEMEFGASVPKGRRSLPAKKKVVLPPKEKSGTIDLRRKK